MNKNIIKNVAYNLLATAIPLAVLQLIILPLMSKRMGDNSYGLSVTMIAFFNICPGVLGIALNNIRLLKYDSSKKNSCFQNILFELCVINILITIIISICYKEGFFSSIFTSTLSFLWLLKEYYIVQFQSELNYVKILINNIIISFGYIIGYFLFVLFNIWQLVYIFGYILGMLHIFISSNYWREKFSYNEKISYYRKEVLFLAFSTVLIRLTTYADRLILYPIMGGKQVSIYYSATIVSKLVSMAINPISSVLLSYLSKKEKIKKDDFTLIFLPVLLVCIIGFFIINRISGVILDFLYPEYSDDALHLIKFTTASTMLYVLISFINPFILKFYSIKWQGIINGTNVILYIICSLIGLKLYDLIGFCIGTIVVNAIKLFVMLLLFYYGKQNNVSIK